MSDSSSGPPAAANGGEEPTVGTEPIVGSSDTPWANENGLNVCPSPSLQPSFTGREDVITTSVSTSSVTDVHSLLQSSDIAKSPIDATSQSSDVHLTVEQEQESKCSVIPMPTDDINRVLADSSELSHLQDCHSATESVSIGSLAEKELRTCTSLQIEETSHSQTRFLTGDSDLATDISPQMLENMSVSQQQPASVILSHEITNIGKESSIRELSHSELVSHATSDESSIHMQDLEQDFKNIGSTVIPHFHLDESQSPELIIPDSTSTLVRSTVSGDSITGICLSPPHTTNVYIPKGMGLPPVSTIIRSSALAAAKGRFDNPYPSHDLNIGLPSSLSKTNSFAAFSSLNVQRTIIDSPSPETMIKLSGPNLSLPSSGGKNLPTTMVDAKMLCIPYSQAPHCHITSRVCDTSSIIVTSAATSCLGPETNIPHSLLDAQSSASKNTGDVTLDHSSLQSTQIHIGTLQEVSAEKDTDPNADLSLSAAAVTSDSATTDETSDYECVSSLTHKNHETANSGLSPIEHIHQVESASVIHSVSSKDITARDTSSIQGSHQDHMSQLPELIRIVNDSRNIVQHMTIQNVSGTTSPQVSTSIPPIRTLLATQKIKPSSSPFAASPISGHISEDANAQSQETDKLESENTMASLGITMEPSNSEVSDNLSAAHEIALQLAMETAGTSTSPSSVNSSGVCTSVIQQFLATESTQGRLSSVVHHPPGGVIASVVTNKVRSPSVVRSIERHILHSPSVITAPTIVESNKAPNSTMTEFPLTSSTVCGSGESAVITCAKPSVSTVSSLVPSTVNATVNSPLPSIASVALPILSNLSATSLASLQANLAASSIQSIPLTVPSLSSESAIQPNLVSPSIQSISPLLLPSILSSAVSTTVPSIKQEPEESVTVQKSEENITVTSTKAISETSTSGSMYASALSTLPSLLKTDGALSGPLPPFTVVSGLPSIVKRELGASLANTFLAAQGTLPSGLLTVKQEKQETDITTSPPELNTTLPSLVLLPSVAPVGLSKIATTITGASNPMSTLTTPVPSQSSTVAFPSVAISTATSTPSGTVTTPTVLVGISATTTVAPATSKDTEIDDKKLCCMMCRNGSPCGLHPTQTQGTSSQGPLLSTDPAKPFRCQLCGKHLASKNVYQLHMRSHSGEKPFTCNLCGHHFSQKTSLTRHMRSHTGERPFPCEVCGKRFADKERIKIHMRTHTGEKPFACEVCGKRFSQKSTVKRHMSVHTGEKPFKCEVCGKGFANRGNLNAHSKTHANT